MTIKFPITRADIGVEIPVATVHEIASFAEQPKRASDRAQDGRVSK
jgi:hypothetical protein